MAALATFAAVLVSLKLARDRHAPKAVVSVNAVSYMRPLAPEGDGEEEDEDDDERIDITVANIGPVPITIDWVSWEAGIFRRERRLIAFDRKEGRPSLPVKIRPEESIAFAVDIAATRAEFGKYPGFYRFKLFGFYPITRRIRVVLLTASGPLIRGRPDERLRAILAGRQPSSSSPKSYTLD